MTRPTNRLVGLIVVCTLIVAGIGYLGLRARHTGTVSVTGAALALGSQGSYTGDPTDPAQLGIAPTTAGPATSTSTRSVNPAHKKTTSGSPGKAKVKHTHRSGPATSAAKTVVSVKKGAALWNEAGITKALADSGVSWFYDWGADRGGVTAPRGVGFVPMIWGAQSVNAPTLATAKKNGSTLLGFNEPDMSGQANMTVDAALDLWPELEATNMRLGAPAVAYGADQSGQWLDRFMTGAKQRGYRVDFIPLHWYGSDFTTASAVSQLESYIKATYARYHKPIWITEYALINFSGAQKFPSAGQQAAFVTASTAMLQKLPYVERYSWFAFPTSTNGADETGLYRPGDVATAMGKAYRAAG